MLRPRICASIVSDNTALIEANQAEVDLFEVRIDLIGPGWRNVVSALKKPWIACNRSPQEGGKADRDVNQRTAELLQAVEIGASIVDLELMTGNLPLVLSKIKTKAQLLLSFHDQAGTPDFETLAGIVKQQIQAGADYCKIVTLARSFSDNLTLLRLIQSFPQAQIIAFAMGDEGRTSRILSPLCGGYLTYASLAQGSESAAGQISVIEMRQIYHCLKPGTDQ